MENKTRIKTNRIFLPKSLFAVLGSIMLASCGAQMNGYTETDGLYYNPSTDKIVPQQTADYVYMNRQDPDTDQEESYNPQNRSDWGSYNGTLYTSNLNNYGNYGLYPSYIGSGLGLWGNNWYGDLGVSNSYYGFYSPWNTSVMMGWGGYSPYGYPYWNGSYGGYYGYGNYYGGYNSYYGVVRNPYRRSGSVGGFSADRQMNTSQGFRNNSYNNESNGFRNGAGFRSGAMAPSSGNFRSEARSNSSYNNSYNREQRTYTPRNIEMNNGGFRSSAGSSGFGGGASGGMRGGSTRSGGFR